MRTVFGIAVCAAVAATLMLTGSASATEKMSKGDCDAVWTKANPSKLEKVPEADLSAYITDMKKVNPDGDGTIEKDEFSKACEMGLVKTSAATESKTQESSMEKETSDRTPGKKTETPLNQVDSAGGETSDRTPQN